MAIYTIAEEGESVFHIVAHQYASETIRFAASELQKYLLRATGTAIPYFSDRCPQRGPEIRIGAGVRGETKQEEMDPEGFVIRGAGEHVTITGGSDRGVLYGVYRFLEIFCGFRAFTGEVEAINRSRVLQIELEEICEAPAFEFRDAYFRNAFQGDFAAKSRFNSSLCDLSAARGGRMKWFNFHHSFSDLVPETLYFDTHPEYFSEINGERVRKSQLCLTNPKVKEIALATLRRWIRENPDCTVFSVAQNDNRRRCTCPNCKKLEEKEGSPAGPILHFVNQLADAIREEAPHVLLHTFAYQYSLPAPKKVVARDNVIVRLCTISCRFCAPLEELAKKDPDGPEAGFVHALQDWHHHAKHLYVWNYATAFRNYLFPFFHFHTLGENIRFFAKNGVVGVLEQGNFAYGGGAAADDLKTYLIGRLLWNPQADVDAEIEAYLEGVYGKEACKPMGAYYHLLEEAGKKGPLTIREYPDSEIVSDRLIREATELLEKALSLTKDEAVRRRITRDALCPRYLTIARMPLDAPEKKQAVEEFIHDVKEFGMTEIMERTSLAVSKEVLLNSLYCKERPGRYSLYYIMQ
ncbi:MAG: DUF4838 domain-containing protein [Clostridia bacterium]|nr:DUF4838 domain-containing protein [Clostridia bacterium]